MPYIDLRKRIRLGRDPRTTVPEDEGELNYRITQEIESYRRQHGDRYSTFNDITGALENAKLEFYRRVIAPYEDQKARENGDVYAGAHRIKPGSSELGDSSQPTDGWC